MEAGYITLFAAWFVCSVLWQFEPLREKRFLRRANLLRGLPIWTFFAPRPGMWDTHILYRDRLADGRTTPWAEVNLGEARRPFHWLFNPRKRLDKLAVDAVSDVKTVKILGERLGTEEEILQQQVKLCKGYLLLMNIIFAQVRTASDSTSRQFAVVESSMAEGERTLRPLFFSPFHRFEG